jgi:D-sedoheptulose 7-phosphate isomerase
VAWRGVLGGGDQELAGRVERVRVPSRSEHPLPQDQVRVSSLADPEADPRVHLRADRALSHGFLGRPLGRGDQGYRDRSAEAGDSVGVAHGVGCPVGELGILIDDDHQRGHVRVRFPYAPPGRGQVRGTRLHHGDGVGEAVEVIALDGATVTVRTPQGSDRPWEPPPPRPAVSGRAGLGEPNSAPTAPDDVRLRQARLTKTVRLRSGRPPITVLRCCYGLDGDAYRPVGQRPVTAPGQVARDSSEVTRLFELRSDPARDLANQADAVADACHAMAVRFHRGGTLVVFGTGGPSADAQHVAVEFVHPVIVGKRALPAISLTTDVATVTGIAEREGVDAIFAHQLRYLAGPADIALGISADGDSGSVLAGLEAASSLGLLTIALIGGHGGRIATSDAVDHLLAAASDDPRVIKEMHVTTYHILWELVHVFFEQPGVLDLGVAT